MTSIERSYASRIVTIRLALLAGGLFVVGTNGFVIAGLLPHIAHDLRTTVSGASYSITLYAIVVAVASPVISVVCARVDRTHLMSAGLAVIAVGTALSATAHSLTVFDVSRVLAALGGAALVPAATAAAPSMLPPEQRGRALAIAGLGFTLATAIGSPLGTALAGIGGWRLPIVVLAVLGAALAVAVAVVVREVPLGAVAGVASRIAVLRSPVVLALLVATLLVTAAFNVVYVFSATVTAPATHGRATPLAVLLLLYGVGGIAGTSVSGRMTDRIGSTRTATTALVAEVVVFAALPLLAHSIVATGVAFLAWGVAAFGAVVPLQHRLVGADPERAAISLSWYSTAMYVGIALAPILGAATLASSPSTGGSVGIPLVGAATAVLALAAFHVGRVLHERRARREPRA